jgi:hypothetical protein
MDQCTEKLTTIKDTSQASDVFLVFDGNRIDSAARIDGILD